MQKERAEALSLLGIADAVLLLKTNEIDKTVEDLQPAILVLGNEYKEQPEIQEFKENYFGLAAKGFFLNILNVGVFIFWGGVLIVSSPTSGKSFTNFALFFAIVLLSYFLTDLLKISVR